MFMTDSGIVIDDKLMQSANASSSILVSFSGSVIEFKFSQNPNADPPILVNDFGRVIEVRFPQYKNAETPMLVTAKSLPTSIVSGITKSPEQFLPLTSLAVLFDSTSYEIPSFLKLNPALLKSQSLSIVTDSKLSNTPKAPWSIFVIVFGIVNDVIVGEYLVKLIVVTVNSSPAVTLDGEEYLSFYQTPSDMIYTAGRLILFFKEGVDSRFHVGDKVKTVI